MPTNIPYRFHIDNLDIKHFRRGCYLFGLVYIDVHILLIRQTTILYEITLKKDISHFFSQSSQREAYEYTLSFSYRYIKY